MGQMEISHALGAQQQVCSGDAQGTLLQQQHMYMNTLASILPYLEEIGSVRPVAGTGAGQLSGLFIVYEVGVGDQQGILGSLALPRVWPLEIIHPCMPKRNPQQQGTGNKYIMSCLAPVIPQGVQAAVQSTEGKTQQTTP